MELYVGMDVSLKAGSFPVFNRAGRNRPLLRDKQSSYVGFSRPAPFSTEPLPHCGVKADAQLSPSFGRLLARNGHPLSNM